MEPHKGYRIAKRLIQVGDIKDLRGIFEVLPGTVVARDLGVQYVRLQAMVENAEDFRLRELYLLAQLIEIDGKDMVQLALAQMAKDSANKSRKKKK